MRAAPGMLSGFRSDAEPACPGVEGSAGPAGEQDRGKKTLVLDLDETLVGRRQRVTGCAALG